MGCHGRLRGRDRRDQLRACALNLRERHGQARRSRAATGISRVPVTTGHGKCRGDVTTVPFVDARDQP